MPPSGVHNASVRQLGKPFLSQLHTGPFKLFYYQKHEQDNTNGEKAGKQEISIEIELIHL